MRTKDKDKVNRIYNAAIKTINNYGFQDSSMSKIAKEAKVSPATIYLYFENKDDMIKKLFIHIKTKIGKSYFDENLELTPTKATFRTIWINHYQYVTSNFEEYVFYENFSNSPLISQVEIEHTRDYCSVFESLLERSKSNGNIQAIQNDILYSLLFGAINHLLKKNLLLKQNQFIEAKLFYYCKIISKFKKICYYLISKIISFKQNIIAI